MNHANEHCPKIRQHLALYAGRDLEQPLCVEVERHLAECESCRVELAQAAAARARIAVLGAETARAVESIELWPALGERWVSERANAKPAAALSAPRAAPRRIWIPVSLAAAAALMIALNWSSEPEAPVAPPISHVVDPSVPIEDVATNAPGADVLGPDALQPDVLKNVGLRRAAPGEERLRDSSAPFGMPRSLLRRGSQDTPNSLAGDNDLR